MTELLLDAIAAWRIVRLIQRDEITEGPRNAYIEWTLGHGHRKLRYLISCPHCLGVWSAAFVLGLRRVPHGHVLRDLLAVAGGVSLWSELEPAATETGT